MNMHVSASQIDLRKDCPRKWGFSYLEGLKEESAATIVGSRIHEHHENFLLTGELPDPNEVMKPTSDSRWFNVGEIAMNGIATLPTLDDNVDILGVEEELDLEIEGIRYKGFIDFLWYDERKDRIQIWDHKTSSNPGRWAKTPKQLMTDTQAMIYSFWVMDTYGVDVVDFSHHVIDTFPNRNDGRITTIPLVVDYVITWMLNNIHPIAEEIIHDYELRPQVKELEYNIGTCNKFGGCPYRQKCKLTLAQTFRALKKG